MSMQDLPDDELDKLFRKSTEEFEPTFNPQAWKAMRRKLEDEDVSGWVWWKVGVLAAFLLLAVLAGYQLLPDSDKSIGKSEVTSVEKPTKNADKKLLKVIEKKLSLNTISKPKIQTIEPEIATDVATVDRQKKSSNEEIAANPLAKTQKTAIAFSNKKVVAVRSNNGNLPILNPIKKQKSFKAASADIAPAQETPQNDAVNDDTESRTFTNEKASKILKDNEINVGLNPLNLQQLITKNWLPFTIATASPIIDYDAPSPLPIKIKAEPSALFRKGLSLRAAIAPDLSYLSMNQMMAQPSVAYGVMLEYRLSKRWSIQTGGFKTIKLYHATGEQYQWPASWNGQKARPTDISATCKIVDIPLNFRYDLSQGTKSRWFATSGISNYIMLNEKYDYIYPPQTTNIKWETWEGTTGNYWLGVMNLSVGFERQISRHLTLQAEPYMKIPLAQVGMGKVMLNTSGIYISARYKFGRF